MNTTTASDIGARIASRLADSLGPRRYAMWFDQSAQFDYEDGHADGGTLHVDVPNRFIADGIDRHFHHALRNAANEELGPDVALHVRISPERFNGSRDATVAADNGHDGASEVATPPKSPDRPGDDALRLPRVQITGAQTQHHSTALRRLRHQLDSFVVGPSNQLAYAAAQRIADDETDAAHPLFIHGGCGLGKTHLLQGICRRWLEHHPDANVLYTTGEQFTNEYITAVRTNKLERFRKWIRGLDLLAVDDVHFIANKQATQQEFLHSFDQIELCGARVVLASDSHPKLIKQFSEALVSRCVRGMVVPIKPPDARTRTRLVLALAERRNLNLATAAARTLGQQAHGSVREIEGTLTKLQALIAVARQNGQRIEEPIGHTLIHQLTDAEAAQDAPRRPVQFQSVLDAVATELAVSRQQILGRGRHRLVVLARALTVYLTRRLTAMSYPELATALGRSNHSTVITAAQRMQKQIDANDTLTTPPHLAGEPVQEVIERLTRQITRG